MSAAKSQMIAALKSVLVPTIRAHHFQGSYPHFFRKRGQMIDLLTVQFGGGGDAFVIEISYVDPEGINILRTADATQAKPRVSATKERHRLGSVGEGDFWFTCSEEQSPQEVAQMVVQYFEREAEVWWGRHAATRT